MLTIENITFEEAQRILREVRDETAVATTAEHQGDFWRKGDAWIGPKVSNGSETAEAVMDEIQRGFIPKNCLLEVESRHTTAVVGREPDWSFIPRRALKDNEEANDEEQRLIDEAHGVLTEWWDKRDIVTILRQACAQMLVTDRGPLRLFVPPVFVDDDGNFPLKDTLAEALDCIYLHKPDLFQSTVYRDEQSQQIIGIYGFRETDEFGLLTGDKLELHGVLTDGIEAGQTIIQIISEGDKPAAAGFLNPARSFWQSLRAVMVNELTVQQNLRQSQPLNLGGHLGIFEMRRPRLLTFPVRQLNALVNVAMTMMGRNVILGGFLERTILGAQLPGEWVTNADGTKTFTPNPLYVGAGATNAFSGQPIYDTDGTTIKGYTTPSVVYRDPVSVRTFQETKLEAYRALLEETSQVHALIAGDAVTSGIARQQAAAAFGASLQPTKIQIERAGRWLLETALAMAAEFSGQAGRFASLRAQFNCQLDLGPISADEQRLAAELAGGTPLLDISTAMVRVGVSDPKAEEAKIVTRRAQMPTLSAGTRTGRDGDGDGLVNEKGLRNQGTPSSFK